MTPHREGVEPEGQGGVVGNNGNVDSLEKSGNDSMSTPPPVPKKQKRAVANQVCAGLIVVLVMVIRNCVVALGYVSYLAPALLVIYQKG